VPTANSTVVITLLPALPDAWPTGSVTGARVRGGITVDFAWSGGKLTSSNVTMDSGLAPRNVQVVYAGKTVKTFATSGGAAVQIPVSG
jgi:alpha-L-fucosidase 2